MEPNKDGSKFTCDKHPNADELLPFALNMTIVVILFNHSYFFNINKKNVYIDLFL